MSVVSASVSAQTSAEPRRNRQFGAYRGVLMSVGLILVLWGLAYCCVYVYNQNQPAEAKMPESLIVSYSIGLGAVFCLLGAFGARMVVSKRDDTNYMIEKCPPLPLKFVNDHDDVWLEGELVCPTPATAPVFNEPAAYFHYTRMEKRAKTGSDGKTTEAWEVTEQRAVYAQSWLRQGEWAIELDLTQARLDHAKTLERKTLTERHTLSYLPSTGPISAVGVVVDADAADAGEDSPQTAPKDSETLVVSETEKKWVSAALEHEARKAAQAKVRRIALPDFATTQAAAEPIRVPGKRWRLTQMNHVPLVVTPMKRGEWFDHAEGEEIKLRIASDCLMVAGFSAAAYYLTVVLGLAFSWPLLAGCVVVGLLAFMPFNWMNQYNRFVAYRIRVANAWAQIDADLKMRRDLLPNVVAVVKAASAHEKSAIELTLDEVPQPSSMATERLAYEARMSQVVDQLNKAAERFPSLKAQANFERLFTHLQSLEEKIAWGRTFFNHAVQEYNTLIQSFPASTWAGRFGFVPLPSWSGS